MRYPLVYEGARDWLRGALVCTAAGAFLAFVGAFGMEAAPLDRRLLYWIPLMLAGGVIGTVFARMVFRSPWFASRPALACLTVAVAMTPPLALVVWSWTNLFFDRGWVLMHLVYNLGPVAVVSAAMTTISYFMERRPRETHAAPAGSAPPRFLERLPTKLKGATLYAVEAEDHYLRIHTDRGSDLILMRLSDAIGELEGIEGAQTHRSWWVAKEAVDDVARGDGRATFVLKNGIEAPVSRTYARTLREEGWY
ncbi:MAG TPA: LytTR family DNA-binding domain-containing protein [Caulobacteraceae bacterium]|nr:LytTR family DNA-binding domain-containing protein [Caulobacteraceae bacterium]